MRVDVKKRIASNIIKLGRHAVGKSMTIGMFDPEIPEALKAEVRKSKRESKR